MSGLCAGELLIGTEALINKRYFCLFVIIDKPLDGRTDIVYVVRLKLPKWWYHYFINEATALLMKYKMYCSLLLRHPPFHHYKNAGSSTYSTPVCLSIYDILCVILIQSIQLIDIPIKIKIDVGIISIYHNHTSFAVIAAATPNLHAPQVHCLFHTKARHTHTTTDKK